MKSILLVTGASQSILKTAPHQKVVTKSEHNLNGLRGAVNGRQPVYAICICRFARCPERAPGFVIEFGHGTPAATVPE
jgi:hypothetical protein